MSSDTSWRMASPRLAGLITSGEAAAINEAPSDIFGTAIEFHAANSNDPGDYRIGEEIDIFGTGGALRYLYRPWPSGCYWGYNPNPAPHEMSGSVSHFFFNLAEGSGDTPYGYSWVCSNAPQVVGIGREAAEQIWFKALNEYFVSNTSIGNPATPANTARAYTLQAAADLFGWCSPQVKAVQAAWVSVDVPGSLVCSHIEVDLDHLVVFAGGASTLSIQSHPGTEPSMLVFSAAGLPKGAEATFEPGEVQAGDKVAMTVTIPSSTPPGTYRITITATSRDSSESSHAAAYRGGPVAFGARTVADAARPFPEPQRKMRMRQGESLSMLVPWAHSRRIRYAASSMTDFWSPLTSSTPTDSRQPLPWSTISSCRARRRAVTRGTILTGARRPRRC